MKMPAFLEVEALRVLYTSENGCDCPALAGLSFALRRAEILGVLGESGSGKSTLAAALLRILPLHAKISAGAIHFEGRNLLHLESREIERIRGQRIALIFQEPSRALHPTIRVGEQISHVLGAHQQWNKDKRRQRVSEMLAAVFPGDPGHIAKKYPHELSGGQRARILIALALCCNPSLIVADEPTASLDPETQQEIVSLFRSLQREFRTTLIWITHSPTLLAGFADRIMVLYAGIVVEIGAADNVLSAPRHPYTQSLLRCLPRACDERLDSHKQLLPAIPGEAPLAAWQGDQCCFEPRCSQRMSVCAAQAPQMVRLEGGHEVSCFHYEHERGDVCSRS